MLVGYYSKTTDKINENELQDYFLRRKTQANGPLLSRISATAISDSSSSLSVTCLIQKQTPIPTVAAVKNSIDAGSNGFFYLAIKEFCIKVRIVCSSQTREPSFCFMQGACTLTGINP